MNKCSLIKSLFGRDFELTASLNQADRQTITVYGARYRAIIIQVFVPKFQDMDVHSLWFRQDTATCHTARQTTQLLQDTF